MSTNFFSSLSGKFDYMSSMSGLIGDYASIKNGSYGSLMKSYVKKVGNKAALNAYRETGSTATAVQTQALHQQPVPPRNPVPHQRPISWIATLAV